MEKPFSDVRRKRHDVSASRAGLHGRTGRRVNKNLIDGTYLCDEKIERTHTTTRHDKFAPTYLTDLELELNDGKYLQSIDKDKRWETVPALLTETVSYTHLTLPTKA